MAEPRLVDEWLKKAEEDYQFAASVLETSAFYAQICFHFHVREALADSLAGINDTDSA